MVDPLIKQNPDNHSPHFFIDRFARSHNDIDGLIAYALFKWDKKEEKIALQKFHHAADEIDKCIKDWCITNSNGNKLENYIKKARELSASFILHYQKTLEDERDSQTANELRKLQSASGWKQQLTMGVVTGLVAAIIAPFFYMLLEKAIQESDVAKPARNLIHSEKTSPQ